MLKALELFGFKSFADKTRFEFPDGITVVVGPNGSGKSNVVDAMKWALGETSAKSLRGKEMADVIFKGAGSGASARKPMNTAEVTIIFDNASGRLPVEAPEVHVTRRVFRSGEGEYLINNQPCRLRDIKDLFRGTGVGTDAYSLIEQGKVDTLLQSSMKDRRALFEEAAGISRFKAKKVEAQRRLERVDQNLLRLKDIVDEVESRLRSVRNQAGKARRYKEYSDRLQQLRTQVAQADWRQLTEKLEAIVAELAQIDAKAAEVSAELEQGEQQAQELERELASLQETLHACEARIGQNRERIAAEEATAEHERRRIRECDDEAARRRAHVAGLTGKAGDLQSQLTHLIAAIDSAESSHAALARQLSERTAAAHDLTARLEGLRREHQSCRDAYLAQLRVTVAQANRISGCQSLRETAAANRQRGQQRWADLRAEADQQAQRHAELVAAEALLAADAARCEQLAAEAQERLAAGRRQLSARTEEWTHLGRRHAAASERALVLDELERRFEGIGAGVKEVLDLAKRPPAPRGEGGDPSAANPWAGVVGLVADTMQTTYEFAPLIDIALGRAAEYVVVDGPELFAQARREPTLLAGRVGLIPVQDRPAENAAVASIAAALDLGDQPGVIGRADRCVETEPRYAPLVARLLGTTWLVERLDEAYALRELAPQCRFVTRAGELLESDGALVIGPPHMAAGLVSRRSELRALRLQIAELEEAIVAARDDVARRERDVEELEDQARIAAAAQQRAAGQLSQQRAQVAASAAAGDQLARQLQTVEAELQAAEEELAGAERALVEAERDHTAAEAELAADEARLRGLEAAVAAREAELAAATQEVTAAQVETAKSEQRLEGLRGQRIRFERDQQERSRALQEAEEQLADCLRRRAQAEQAILACTSALADLYLSKELCAEEAVAHLNRRSELTRVRGEWGARGQKLRSQLRKCENERHKLDLAAGEVRHEQQSLAQRLRDDYGLELAELEAPADPTVAEARAAVDEEIADLRRKLNQLGAVNLEALTEIEELETRFNALHGQYTDLTQAKESLEKIIHRINADSRRLFAETLEAIRTNFQAMFRKVFGGGQADIVLEPNVDILEAGIDIIATPVGKQSLGLSLLSGGERALTAVTLLLAIFEFRPSPFCVLDEVDGPLDEANIGRFVDVLKGFLSTTKFVVVTHSKKTMTAANTLYGVTMQESGVSKRVSVRFDDVSDDGQIRASALDRDVA